MYVWSDTRSVLLLNPWTSACRRHRPPSPPPPLSYLEVPLGLHQELLPPGPGLRVPLLRLLQGLHCGLRRFYSIRVCVHRSAGSRSIARASWLRENHHTSQAQGWGGIQYHASQPSPMPCPRPWMAPTHKRQDLRHTHVHPRCRSPCLQAAGCCPRRHRCCCSMYRPRPSCGRGRIEPVAAAAATGRGRRRRLAARWRGRGRRAVAAPRASPALLRPVLLLLLLPSRRVSCCCCGVVVVRVVRGRLAGGDSLTRVRKTQQAHRLLIGCV